MILRFLNWQGIAGIAVTAVLLIMLTVQKLEAVHWKKQSESFEHLYQQEQAAFATTVADARCGRTGPRRRPGECRASSCRTALHHRKDHE